jgi:hypothetical protein
MYVPGWMNVNLYDAPVDSESDEKIVGEPVSETTICGAPSWFTHVTIVPVFTVSGVGSNAKFLIVIEFPPPVEACGAAVAAGAGGVWLEEQPAATHARITSAIQTEQSTKGECLGILP